MGLGCVGGGLSRQTPSPRLLASLAHVSPDSNSKTPRAMVKTADGFTYVNEGTAEKPKPGYVATKPGSVLRIAISTDRSPVAAVGAAAAGSALAGGGGGGIAAATAAVAAATAAVLPNATPVHVYLHHLRSYTNMGVAKFR